MRERRETLPASLPPRGLSREQAAEYFGVSVGTFNQLVRDGLAPPPKRLRQRAIWDRKQLDAAFDALADDKSKGALWDRVAL